ncbi:hypothetical protein KIN20_017203 [Parelaphostrongylus tenuis]|uniref:Uncharacterized protein n=1 Tax=Parelaphostrongylus tenuis TaxID=148309 RepID=A0AAD5MHM1_PARTN|nr:hypothetical protein KIN20_017203 [Parelaphostrongylus tenuis]
MKSVNNFFVKISRRFLRNDGNEFASVKENTGVDVETERSRRNIIESYCEPENVGGDVGAAETRRTIRNSPKHEISEFLSDKQKEENQSISVVEKSERREGSRKNKVVEKLQQSGSGCKEPKDVSGKSFGRLRNLSGKVSYKVKTFFSRPEREPATRKLISRIEARRRAQNDNNRTKRESHSGQRAFSRPRNRSLERLRNGPDQVTTCIMNEARDDSLSVAEENCSNREESAELANDNGNAVIVNGLPFWITADDPLLIDQEDSDTDDELPLNADIVLDVHKGNIELDAMPATALVSRLEHFSGILLKYMINVG